MYDMTAAHPTLPLGSYVRVTNLRNGRAVVVKVNDRGPIIEGRIIRPILWSAQALQFNSAACRESELDTGGRGVHPSTGQSTKTIATNHPYGENSTRRLTLLGMQTTLPHLIPGQLSE